MSKTFHLLELKKTICGFPRRESNPDPKDFLGDWEPYILTVRQRGSWVVLCRIKIVSTYDVLQIIQFKENKKNENPKPETAFPFQLSLQSVPRSGLQIVHYMCSLPFSSLLLSSFLLQASVSYHILSYPLSSFDLIRLVSSLLVWSGLLNSRHFLSSQH